MDKPAFDRVCPDCDTLYTVNESYSDEAYIAHRNDEDGTVCNACYEAFCGITLDEILDLVYDKVG